MKWIAISGSWRKTNEYIEKEVRGIVREIVSKGEGIVTGGALNVDYFATDEALRIDPEGWHIKVCLPVTLERYAAHYRKRADEGVITHEQAERLVEQLTYLKRVNPKALIENEQNTVVDNTTYFERNQKVIDLADELIAFQVNDSGGVQDTVEKAFQKGITVKKFSYQIP